MRHTLPQSHQFYVTAPQPCPYLPGKVERKLFTALQGDGARHLNDVLSHQGFRRSQNVLYRPSCAGCSACLSARIVVGRVRADAAASAGCCGATRDLERVARSPWATEAQYQLFRRYLDARHATGGMADMDMSEFAAMIEESPVRSRVIEYYPRAGLRRSWSAVCLTDVLSDGVSMVYSFFDPDLARDSLGSYIILDHVAAGAPSRGCRTSISATGCRAAPRWTTSPATSRSRSSPRAAGAGWRTSPTPARWSAAAASGRRSASRWRRSSLPVPTAASERPLA